MGIKDIGDEIAREWAVIREAPFLFMACVALCCYIVWRLVQWQQGAVLGHRDAEIATLKRQLDAGQASSTIAAANTAASNAPTKPAVSPANVRGGLPEPRSRALVPLEASGDVFKVGALLNSSASIEDQKEANTFLGSLTSVIGSIRMLSVNSGKIIATIDNPNGYSGPSVQVFLEANDSNASLLKKGDVITAKGCIGVINQSAIALTDAKIEPQAE